MYLPMILYKEQIWLGSIIIYYWVQILIMNYLNVDMSSINYKSFTSTVDNISCNVNKCYVGIYNLHKSTHLFTVA